MSGALAFSLSDNIPLRFTYGDKTVYGIPKEFSPVVSRRLLDTNMVQYVIEGEDESGLSIRAEYIEYRDYPVTEWIFFFGNNKDTDTALLKNIRIEGKLVCPEAVLEYGNGDTRREDGYTFFKKPVTEAFPAGEPPMAQPNYRGRIAFDGEKCINCGMCERVCAGGAIKTEAVPVEGGQQITRTFNLGSCAFCSHCADFCHEKAIELTGDYHMVATKEEDLLVTGTFFKAAPKKPAPKPAAAAAAPAPAPTVKMREDGKPVQDPARCVYCTLCAKKCPAGALTVDRAEKKWELDEDVCVGCGTCAEACPKKAIII